MKMLERLGRLFRANMNAAIDGAESRQAGILLEQSVEDMKTEVQTAKKALVGVVAEGERLRVSVERARREQARWSEMATRAQGLGETALALEASERAERARGEEAQAIEALRAQESAEQTMRGDIQRMERRYTEARGQVAILGARNEVAKAQGALGGGAVEAFGEIAGKIEANVIEAQITQGMLGDGGQALEQFARETVVEQQLAYLKKRTAKELKSGSVEGSVKRIGGGAQG